MTVTMRKGDDVAGTQCYAFPTLESNGGVPFVEEVKDDDVARAAHEDRCQRARFRRQETPGLRQFGIEVDRRVETDDPQDFRQRIHSEPRVYSRRQTNRDAGAIDRAAKDGESSQADARTTPPTSGRHIVPARASDASKEGRHDRN